jgi:TMEM175 potassium channel family protein
MHARLSGGRSAAEASYDRLIAFSDAVFAIAATLLVIDLRPPTAEAGQYEAALAAYLRHPQPFIATAIGFLVVASYWSSHRRVFLLVGGTSGLLVWANGLTLFGVAIQPFLTAALAEHDPNRTSVVLYAGAQVATGLAQLGLWATASRQPSLLTEDATPRRVRYLSVQLLRAPMTFALSIPVTLLVGPEAGMASWAAMVALAVCIDVAFRDVRHPSAVEEPEDGGRDALDPQRVLGAARMEAVARDQ